jgi:hypothetical protein
VQSGAQKGDFHWITAAAVLHAVEMGIIAEHRNAQQQDDCRSLASQERSVPSCVVASTSISPDGVQSRRTVIRFSVRVPVLSVRMTVVAPSVSTADRRSINGVRFYRIL